MKKFGSCKTIKLEYPNLTLPGIFGFLLSATNILSHLTIFVVSAVVFFLKVGDI